MPRGALNEWIEGGPRPRRLWYLHGRLVLATLLGRAIFVCLLTVSMRTPTRILASWDIAIGSYLALLLGIVGQALVARIRQRASVYDEGALIVLTLTSSAALASPIAVFAELGHPVGPQHPYGWFDALLGIGTIILSSIFMHTISHFRTPKNTAEKAATTASADYRYRAMKTLINWTSSIMLS